MKVSPVASPHQIVDNGSNASTAQSARARAIAKIAGQPAQVPAQAQPPQQVVQDQNAISVEELGAIQGQKSTNEAPVETPEPPAAKEEPLSSQHALLARKERALRAKAQQQDQALKAREAALQAKEDALKAKEQEYATGYISKSRFKQNPLEALADAEVTYDEVTQAAIDAQNVNPQVSAHIKRLEAKLAKLEEQSEQQTKAFTDQQTSAYQSAVKQIKQDATRLVNADPNFETIKATRSINEVVDLIEQNFKETGEVMSVEEAALEVENHLLEEIEKLMKIEKIKKRQQTLNASTNAAQTQQPSPKQTQPMKTLTNASSSTRTLSAKERAILAFKGELKT